MSIHRRSPRTVTAIGSMAPGQSAFRSPGTLRSRCRDHKQTGQWLRCDVPGASSETSTPQCPQRNERGNDKSENLSELEVQAGQTFRLLSPSAGGCRQPDPQLSFGAATDPSTTFPRGRGERAPRNLWLGAGPAALRKHSPSLRVSPTCLTANSQRPVLKSPVGAGPGVRADAGSGGPHRRDSNTRRPG